MKKEYIAPDLYFESFVLSESIAAGCTEVGGTQSYIEMNLFSSDVPKNNQGITADSCIYDYDVVKSEWGLEEFCYTTGTMKLFLS